MMDPAHLGEYLDITRWPLAETAAWALLLSAAAVLIDRIWSDVVQSAWRRGLDRERRLSYSLPLLRIGLLVTVSSGTLYALWAMHPVAAMALGGIAIGSAVLLGTDHLRDMVGGLTLALTRPFRVGDTIESDTLRGRIEHIALTECILRGAGGEVIRAPNRQLARDALRVAHGGEALPEEIEVELPEGTDPALATSILRDLVYLSAYTDASAPVVVELQGRNRARIRATPIAPDEAADLVGDVISRVESLSRP